MKNNYYDPNGFYTHSLEANSKAQAPHNAIRCDLPEFGENECLKLNDEKDGFVVLPDFTGTEYYEQDGTKKVWGTKGEELPNSILTEPPPNATHLTHDGSEWVQDEQLKFESDTATWRAERASLVAAIVVEHNGISWDGDETSQTRLGRTWPLIPDGDTIMWTAADNIDYPVTNEDLKTILTLAGLQQSAIWREGRPFRKETQ